MIRPATCARCVSSRMVSTVGQRMRFQEFEERHAIGSRARLAFALLLHTGQRRSDVIRMGRQHVRDDVLQVRQVKTGTELMIPLHPALTNIITANSD